MGRYSELINPEAIEYVLNNSVRERPLMARLREETARLENAGMQIPPEQGQFMQLLMKMLGAQYTIEVGVFTGYSSLAVALALPAEGKIVACDVSTEFTDIARKYWAEAGVDGKIDLRIGPASDTLAAMIANDEVEQFDFAFIDADKASYPTYYEQCLELVRKGGVIALDNMLQSGQVMEDPVPEGDPEVLHKLNQFILRDERVDALLLPFSDGLTLVVKR